jgi:hypothetical protein
MKKFVIFLFFLALLAGCQPSEEVIQQAIAETEAAKPTETQIPPTPIPTDTPTMVPTMEYCNIDDVNTAKDQLMEPIVIMIEILETSEKVNSSSEFIPLQNDLLKIQKDILAIEYPPCFDDAFVFLNKSVLLMDEGFEVAINGDWNSGATKINLSGEYLIQSANEVQEIIDCLPNCNP